MTEARHYVVSEWADIEQASSVSDRDKHRVADIFTSQSWDAVVWVPDWLLEEEEKDIETVEASAHLAVGDVEDYSEKAWRLRQAHRDTATAEPEAFLPKASVTVFERLQGVGSIDSPQRGLGEFGGL